MQFVNPGFLYALVALAIPVIVHLFNFRRFKKITFTNVRFLREIKLETQHLNRLKHLLVLISRLLAFAFLIFAFAQPFIPVSNGETSDGVQTYGIFIDNSFSMEGESSAGSMFEVARNRAIDIASAASAADKFQLLSQEFEGRDQRFISQQSFRDRAQELDMAPQSRDLAAIVDRQNDLLSDEGNSRRFIISDFQKSRYDFEHFVVDSGQFVSLVHIDRNSAANLYIDSVWFKSPIRKLGAADEVQVRIANTSDEAVENVPIKLFINGSQLGLGSFSAAANGITDTTLFFINEKPGMAMAEIRITDAPVSFDDHYYFAFEVFEKIDVLHIRRDLAQRDAFQAIFNSDSAYTYRAVPATSVNYAELNTYSFIILDELKEIATGLASELKNFINNGGSLWLIPSADSDFESYNNFLSQSGGGALLSWRDGKSTVRNLDLDHPLYSGIFQKIPRNLDLPIAEKYAQVSSSVRSLSQSVLSFSNGDPFLQVTPSGQGSLYLLSAPLSVEANNFNRHALFVASTLRMAELSRITAMRSIELDAKATFSLPATNLDGDEVIHMKGFAGQNGSSAQVDIIPQLSNFGGATQITLGPELQRAGLFYLIGKTDTLAGIGVNYKREESDIASYSLDELKAIAEARGDQSLRVFDAGAANLAKAIAQDTKGRELWKICLILALVFLLIEGLLLRFWKKPTT